MSNIVLLANSLSDADGDVEGGVLPLNNHMARFLGLNSNLVGVSAFDASIRGLETLHKKKKNN